MLSRHDENRSKRVIRKKLFEKWSFSKLDLQNILPPDIHDFDYHKRHIYNIVYL